MRRTGVERVDNLLTDALLNPELARTLLMKATPGNRVLIPPRLGSQLGALAATASAEATGEGQRRPGPRELSPSMAIPRIAVPPSTPILRAMLPPVRGLLAVP